MGKKHGTSGRAAVYCRISNDQTGQEAGVDRQQRDGLDYCKRAGLDVIEVFVDNDISASRYGKKRRPAFDKMLRAVEAGEIDTVVAWHVDRLYRRPAELEALLEHPAVASNRVTIKTLFGEYDLSNADAIVMLRIGVTFAAKASDDTSRRVRRMNADKVAKGLPHSGQRPFGYEADAVTINKAEAKIVRDLATRLLAGESQTSLANELNGRGISTANGKLWTATTIRSVVTNPHVAGLRRHHDEVVPGTWKPLLPRDTWERLRAMYGRRRGRGRHSKRTGMLTGLVRCRTCGEVMTRDTANDGSIVLRCKRAPGRPKACGRNSVEYAPVEQAVTGAVLDAFSGPRLGVALSREPHHDEGAADDLAEIEGRLAELADMYADGEIGRTEWLRSRQRLEDRHARAQAALSAQVTSTALSPWVGRGGALEKAWPKLTTDQQRAIVSAVIDRVIVDPASRRTRAFTADRIRPDDGIVWRV